MSWLSVGLLPVWAFAGGLLVRPHGRWREVPLIAGALVGYFVVAFVVLAAVLDDGTPGNDDAAAVGAMFLVAITLVPAIALVALGRCALRGIGRRRRLEPSAA